MFEWRVQVDRKEEKSLAISHFPMSETPVWSLGQVAGETRAARGAGVNDA